MHLERLGQNLGRQVMPRPGPPGHWSRGWASIAAGGLWRSLQAPGVATALQHTLFTEKFAITPSDVVGEGYPGLRGPPGRSPTPLVTGCCGDHLQRTRERGGGSGRVHREVCQPFSCSRERWACGGESSSAQLLGHLLLILLQKAHLCPSCWVWRLVRAGWTLSRHHLRAERPVWATL